MAGTELKPERFGRVRRQLASETLFGSAVVEFRAALRKKKLRDFAERKDGSPKAAKYFRSNRADAFSLLTRSKTMGFGVDSVHS
jgi:hypothetical protein